MFGLISDVYCGVRCDESGDLHRCLEDDEDED